MGTRELNESEVAAFDSERRWLDDYLRHFGDEFALTRTPDDIPTLQSLLDIGPFASGDTGSLEALGGALGDVVCDALTMRWVVVDDEYGSDFAIQYGQVPVYAFPRDMIVKRVESGEQINVTDLYEGLISALREQLAAHLN